MLVAICKRNSQTLYLERTSQTPLFGSASLRLVVLLAPRQDALRERILIFFNRVANK